MVLPWYYIGTIGKRYRMSGELPHFDDEEGRRAAEELIELLAGDLEAYVPPADQAAPPRPYIVPPPDLPPPSEN
jgi:hypothetical protein